MNTPTDSTSPTPARNKRRAMEKSLRRDNLVGDERVKLGNGELWMVPALPLFPLTMQFRETDAGGIEAFDAIDPDVVDLAVDVEKVFNEIYEASKEIDANPDAEPSGDDFGFAAAVAYRLLAVNYKLTPDLVNLTGLIQTTHVVPVILAAYGQKKTAIQSLESSTSASPSLA